MSDFTARAKGMNLDTPAERVDYCVYCGTTPCVHPVNPVFAEYDADRERYLDTLYQQRTFFALAALGSTVLWVVFLVLLVARA